MLRAGRAAGLAPAFHKGRPRACLCRAGACCTSAAPSCPCTDLCCCCCCCLQNRARGERGHEAGGRPWGCDHPGREQGPGTAPWGCVPCRSDVLGVHPAPICPTRQKHAGELPHSRGALAPAWGHVLGLCGPTFVLKASGEGPDGGVPMGFWGPVAPQLQGLFTSHPGCFELRSGTGRNRHSRDRGGCRAGGRGSRQHSDSRGGSRGAGPPAPAVPASAPAGEPSWEGATGAAGRSREATPLPA